VGEHLAAGADTVLVQALGEDITDISRQFERFGTGPAVSDGTTLISRLIR
jgi:hypothetical protein